MEKKPIIPIPNVVESPISTLSTPETFLRNSEFEAFIFRKGYPCYLDRFIQCPCKESGSNSARVTCCNCYGSGWVLVERLQTISMFQSMSFNPERQDWSIDNLGTVSITTLERDKPKFMDRFVLYEEFIEYTELIFPIYLQDGSVIAFCDYPPIEILDLRMFQGDNQKLLKIDPAKIKIDEEGRLDLTGIKDILYQRQDFIFKSNTSLSIRYTYHPSYHVLDVTRNVITSPTQDTNTKIINRSQFPYHAVGRLSHLVLERGNLKNLPSGYQDNLAEGTTIQEQMKGLDVSKELCDVETENKNQKENKEEQVNLDIYKI